MKRFMKYYREEKGITLVLIALMLAVLLFFLGMAVDISYMYHVKNQLQVAADAAALAGGGMGLSGTYTGDPAVLQQNKARCEAWKFAQKNNAAGSPVYLVTNSPSYPADCNDATTSNTGLNEANDVDGDIVVGNWDPSRAQSPVDLRFRPTSGNPLQSGDAINAIKTRPRRTGDTPGMPKARVFVGQVFRLIGIDWSRMSAAANAIASGGGSNLAPISVNEYWMGDSPVGGGDCGDPTKPDFGRTPYGIYHVYPDSFVRPPCSTMGASNCSSPPNGNVASLPSLSCDPPGPTGPTPVTISPNGPLPLTSPCSGVDCKGRLTSTSGRVFAIVGGSANGNSPSFDIAGLLNLDQRNGCSKPETCPSNQWYQVSGSTFTPIPHASSSPDKDVVAGYIAAGVYPNILPISVTEVFQPGYIAISLYTASSPYASTSYYGGLGDVGNLVKANFYGSGSYSGGKYAPGQKIIVAVYDGIVGGTGSTQKRTTIVGFARVTIFGYGNSLNVTGNSPANISVSGTELTMYGYIADTNDALQQDTSSFSGGPPKLVK